MDPTYHCNNLAQVTHGFQMPFLILIPVRNNDLCAHPCWKKTPVELIYGP
jgi:hypothetical protein